jgi:hypothetical protein
MADLPSLSFDEEPESARGARSVEEGMAMFPRSIDDRFAEFHAEFPAVYLNLVRLAREAVVRGHKRIGIGMLWEVLRWETQIGDHRATYKLNDHYRSRYARLIIAQEPDLAEVFEIRELRTP